MDQHKEFRITYLGAAPHTLVTALMWLISGLFWDFYSVMTGVLVIIIGGMLIFPLGELLRSMLSKNNTKLQKSNKLS